jgi:hypothetical protein
MKPSTAWSETIAPDESARFAEYATKFAEMQRKKSERFGNGRALHRKQLIAMTGQLTVAGDLPEPARHGLFARAGSHEAVVRFSNGGTDRLSDRRPDIRGMAVKVRGLAASPSALGGSTTEQDFLLINQPKFGFATSDEFVGLVLAAAPGPGSLVRYMIRRYGFFNGLGRLREFGRVLGKKFPGFAASELYSAAPIACGPYAAKVRAVPVGNPAPATDNKDWAADLRARSEMTWDLQLQFFVDEATTPIEDASVEWPSPFVTVGRLTIGTQSEDLEAATEALKFDPWNALAEHRPLGDVMRARKVVYYESQKVRGVS